MAYDAAVSIRRSLLLLSDSSDKFANIHCPTPYIDRLWDMILSIKAFDFEKYCPGGKHLENEIRDALWKAEDIVESYIISTFLLPSQDIGQSSSHLSTNASNFSQHLQEVTHELASAKEKMEKFADDQIQKHRKDDSISSIQDYLTPQYKNKMVGLEEESNRLKSVILRDARRYLGAVVIHGMGGIGKTSLAISIYNDSHIRNQFSVGSWVKISLEHSVRDILLGLLHTLEVFSGGRHEKILNHRLIGEDVDEEELANLLRVIFGVQKFLVVVDCLCDINISSWNYIKSILHNTNNGSRILLVNRMNFLDDELIIYSHKKNFLSVSDSWNLLREQVFGDMPCPGNALERIGKKIAEKCGKLPLAIICVARHLAEEERKTVEYWKKVAESGNSIAYDADGASMFEQLGLSYKQMPPYLRPIYLYLGAFPESKEVPILELQNLWLAEVLLDWEEFGTSQNLSARPLEFFWSRNLVFDIWKGTEELFTWLLHHVLWHFCCNQAKEDGFFHVMDKYSNDWEDDRNIRRLVIRKSMLFGILEGICELEHSLSTVRSLLFTGPYNPYPQRISWGSYKMLKVINARSIRFYEFPREILHLTLLRYLALTLNGGELPPGISKLRNLISLIVNFHHLVRSCEGDPSYLPTEIWDMRQLVNLECMGCDLPVPPRSDALLPCLSTLHGVSPRSCVKEVLERIPNLIQIRIRSHIAPKSDPSTCGPLDHHVVLAKLLLLTWVIENPYFDGSCGIPQDFAMLERFIVSMDNLTCLSLSGCGFHWESIEPISQMPSLLDLELRCHAFRGPKWELRNKGFKSLKSITLEDLDLVYWTATSREFFLPCLRTVRILQCHKLQEVSPGFVHCRGLSRIAVIDSSHAAETWAQSMRMERETIRLIISSHRKYIDAY